MNKPSWIWWENQYGDWGPPRVALGMAMLTVPIITGAVLLAIRA